MNYVKTNQTYIVAGVIIVVVLGLILWNRGRTPEVSNKIVDTSTSIPTNTQNTNQSIGAGNIEKPAPSPRKTTTSKSTETITPESVPSIPSASSLNGWIFKMTYYNGSAVPVDSRYTISFEKGILSAKFCNSMSGNFVLDGSLLKVSNLVGTAMGCSTPTNLMEIESAFGSMLNFGATLYQSGNKLILSSSKGTVMVFIGF